jgi:hypothetical protein
VAMEPRGDALPPANVARQKSTVKPTVIHFATL